MAAAAALADLLDHPKAIFGRVHQPRKVYHRRDWWFANRGLIVRSLDLRHLPPLRDGESTK